MRRLARFAGDQHGVFTLDDATAHGIAEVTVWRAVDAGEVVRLHDRVYRFVAAPHSWEADLLAACLAAPGRAVASHRAAAMLHGLPGGHRVVEITCDRWRRTRQPGIRVHETGALGDRDVTRIGVLPVATVARTLLDLSGCAPYWEAEAAVEHALRRKLTTLTELDGTLARLARRGRPGTRTLRRIVRPRLEAVGFRPTESEAESAVLRVIRRHGLPEPTRQVKIRDSRGLIGRVDLAYPGARVVIEYDSDEFHTGRVATAADSARRHRLVAAGWLPITAVKPDLRAGGGLFAAALRAALAERSCVAQRAEARVR
jgi:very-short-patch-repair endonuclease